MAETTGPLLDLETIVSRPTIAIDGKLYDILRPDELPIATGHRFAAWGRRIEELGSKPELDDGEAAELSHALRALTDGIMVGVPEPLRARLTEEQRLAVAEVFTVLRLPRRLETAQTAAKILARTEAPRASIGANSSRGSSGSTAARPGGGSSTRLSGSCGPS